MPDSSWTETGSSISLIPTTTPIDPGSSPANANYLTNAYKAALMQQYAGELAMKTSLDSLATTWGCSATAYNNAVAAINTTITGFSGAPANWATIWPDGTMSGPWVGIQTLLSADWSAIATQRTALQSAISAAQAAAAQAAAITAAVSQAATNAASTYAASIAAPLVVSSLPTLPSPLYPTGKLVLLTATGILYQSTGSTWATVTVSGGSLTANSITAGQIAAGAIGATQIAAGAITAAALTVCDWTNLCYNPGFETGTNAQWDSGTVSTAYANTGSYSLKLPNGGGTYAVRNLNRIPVVAGQVFLAQCWVYVSATLTSGGAYVRIRGLNAAGVEVFTGASGTFSSPVGTWTQISTTQTIPAGVVAANLEIVSASPVGGDIYVDDCYYRRCDDATLIVDGSITTSKLNSACVYTGTLNASQITAGTLTATTIYFTDGFCLNTLEPKEAGANVTSAHILTANSHPTNTVTVTGIPSVIVGGFAFSVNASSASDVYNIFGRVAGTQTAGLTGDDCYIDLYVDGVLTNSQDCYFPGLNLDSMVSFYMSITGLSAGAHTFQFYAHSGRSATTWQIFNTSTALCQRIF
jgi:hypothetical protein